MSRFDEGDDGEGWEYAFGLGWWQSTKNGKTGQAFLREMLASLDAMPDKRLVYEELQTPAGDVCALGCVARARGIDFENTDPTDHRGIARRLGVSTTMAIQVAATNDFWHGETPEARWTRVRAWVAEQIRG